LAKSIHCVYCAQLHGTGSRNIVVYEECLASNSIVKWYQVFRIRA